MGRGDRRLRDPIHREGRDPCSDTSRSGHASSETDERRLSSGPGAGNLSQQAGAGGASPACGSARRDAPSEVADLRGIAPTDKPRRGITRSVESDERTVSNSDVPVQCVQRGERCGRPTEIVEVARKSRNESRAGSAMREVGLRLTLLILARDASDVSLEDRLSITAPFAALDGSQLLREFVDAATDLLAICPWRKVCDQPADLLRLQSPAVAQQHHCAAAWRHRGEQVARQLGALGADDDFVWRSSRVDSPAHEFERCGRFALAAAKFSARLVSHGSEHVATNLVVIKFAFSVGQRSENPEPGAGVDVVDLVG
jgi:hypothetical protein